MTYSELQQLRKDLNQPKHELKTIRVSKKGSLSGLGKGLATFKNYNNYNDTLDMYELTTNDYQAFNGIKGNFKYDYMMGEVKDVYSDEFGRKVYVKKVS